MTVNGTIKQARQWKAEIAEMTRRGKPHSEDVVGTMADILSAITGFTSREGICPESTPENEKRVAIMSYLRGTAA